MNKVALPLAYSYLNKITEDFISSTLILLQIIIQACVHTISDAESESQIKNLSCN